MSVEPVGVAILLLVAADSLGRRRSLLWTSVAQALCRFYIGLYSRFDPLVAGQVVLPAEHVALVRVLLYAAFFYF